MNAQVLDQYPSTYDLPRLAGGQDPVLAILQGARKRYARSMSTDTYMASSGAVCAIGAITREDGLTGKQYDAFDVDNSCLASFEDFVEERASAAAKEAIEIIDSVAAELYPDECQHDGWTWALESLNQELPKREAKKAVLRCYDVAIEHVQNRQPPEV